MLTYDTRVLAVMVVLSLVIFKISKTQWKQVGAVFKMIMLFLVLNVIAIFLFSPDQGTHIYGTRTVLFHLAGPYDVTKEQLFYELNVIINSNFALE
jgi:energy-coupling factor transport system permease protein